MFSDPQGVPVWLQTHSVILAGILSSMKDSMVSEGQPQDPDPGFFDNAMVVDSKMTKSVVANIFEISDKIVFETFFYIWQVCPLSLWVPRFFQSQNCDLRCTHNTITHNICVCILIPLKWWRIFNLKIAYPTHIWDWYTNIV